ncbi:MAG: flagellar hook-length control protein FliK, partial [Candidatus Margulisiibacteriota bacterium]
QPLKVIPMTRKEEPAGKQSEEVAVVSPVSVQTKHDILPIMAHRKSENLEFSLTHPDLTQTTKVEMTPVLEEDPKVSFSQNLEKQEKQDLVLSQFRSFMAINKLKSATELTLKLHPKELGEIKISLTRIENTATHEPAMIVAKFQVSSEMVKSILESNFNFLKDSLSQQAQLTVGSLSVDVNTQGGDQAFEQHLAHQPTASPSSGESFPLSGSVSVADPLSQETQPKHTVLSSLA